MRNLVTLLLFSVVLSVSSQRGRSRGRGRKKGRPVTMCRYLDECYFPYYPWCLQDFDVVESGRTILFARPPSGLLRSGTRHKDSLGSIILFTADDVEVIQLGFEIILAPERSSAAQLTMTVFRTMCGNFLQDMTLCDPFFVHDEAFPFIDTCLMELGIKDHYLTFNSLGVETDGTFLTIYFNKKGVGRLALPHEDCFDKSTPRVSVSKVAYTNKPRSMTRTPICCN